MTISRAETGFNQRDMKIALALGAGKSIKEAAEFAEISERQAYNRLTTNKKFIEEWRDLLKNLIGASRRQVREIAEAEARAEITKLLGASFDSLERALNEGDLKLAFDAGREVRDRVLGKATSNLNVNHGGTVGHMHAHWNGGVLPESKLRAIDAGIQSTKLLKDSLPLLEGELVDGK
jgi:hypothetical protein